MKDEGLSIDYQTVLNTRERIKDMIVNGTEVG